MDHSSSIQPSLFKRRFSAAGRLRRALLPALVAVLCAAALPAQADAGAAEENGHPFPVGERLTYQLRWGIFIAGTAVLEVHPLTEIEGETARHFSLSVRTTRMMDRFYRVRDRIDGYVREDFEGSLLYLVKKEGNHPRDIRVTYDLENGTAQYVNFDQEPEVIEIPPATLDPLSVLFAFRKMQLEEGEEFELPVADGRRAAYGLGQIGRLERVMVPAGTFNAFVMEPNMREVEGVFDRQRGATIRMWFTDDERRIPVRMQSRVAVGSFRADLASVERIEYPAEN